MKGKRGLTSEEVEISRREHGTNALTQIPRDPLWKKILEGFKDPMIMILLVALRTSPDSPLPDSVFPVWQGRSPLFPSGRSDRRAPDPASEHFPETGRCRTDRRE